jgi:glycerol-3-phosphate acyltransferase PlsY
MQEKNKKRLKWFIIYTVVFWIAAILLIQYVTILNSEENANSENKIIWKYSPTDLQFLSLLTSLMWYSIIAIGAFIVYPKRKEIDRDMQSKEIIEQ